MEILTRHLFLGLLLSLGLSASAATSEIIVVPNGTVDVRESAEGTWRPITEKQTVRSGQEIRTHENSTADLFFADGSRVQIGRDSIFAISHTDTKEHSFYLKLGKIRAAFAGLLSSRVSIRTPTAVCAVRGTVFDVNAGASDTQVTMAEGVLEVKDNLGKQAVITSEETLKIGEKGMEKPHMVPLNGPDALTAVRPYAVHQEMARDATRTMLEDIRNRELKANEAQLGKSVVDAFGRRVRLEEYLLRPDTKSFKVLFLSHREDRFDWGHIIQSFHSAIPDDLSQVPAIISGSILSEKQPTNWLTSFEFYATNTVDALREVITLGDPVLVPFTGFGRGSLWYPSSSDFVQTLYGPGVPGGQRVQFIQHQDWNRTYANVFTWSQSVQPNATASGSPTQIFEAVLDPTNAAAVAAGSSGVTAGGPGNAVYDNTNTITTYPNGPTKADFTQQTTYWDGTAATPTTLTVQKILVSNDGEILDFSNPTAKDFTRNGNYNLEINIKSNLFQGRDIDVLIAPEILRQKSQQTGTGAQLVQ